MSPITTDGSSAVGVQGRMTSMAAITMGRLARSTRICGLQAACVVSRSRDFITAVDEACRRLARGPFIAGLRMDGCMDGAVPFRCQG